MESSAMNELFSLHSSFLFFFLPTCLLFVFCYVVCELDFKFDDLGSAFNSADS